DAPLTATGTSVQATRGDTFQGLIATFSDADPNAAVDDFTATIDWGDGSVSDGTVVADPSGGFDVLGSNVYAAAGTFTVSVRVLARGAPHAATSSSATVADAAPAVTGTDIQPAEGILFTGEVARFLDEGVDTTAADYSAWVTWGPGDTT